MVPEGIEGLSVEPDTIRGFVCDAVGRIIRSRLPGATDLNLTTDQIAGLRQLPELQQLGAELRTANDTIINWHHPPEMPPDTEGIETPRGLVQARALRRQVEHSQQAPLRSRDPASPYSDGLLIVGPGSIGKTVFQGLNLNYAGIGLPTSEIMPKRRTGLGILHDTALFPQFLDPDETLQRFTNAGGRTIKIGAYYADRRDGHDEYDYLLTTPDSYETAVEKGAVNLRTTVRFLLDEAHRTALAPRMQRHVTRFGPGLYMYTATPAIARGKRDLRQRFPYSEFGSPLEYTQDGILSPVQLFSYRAGPESDSAEKIAIRQAIGLLESGRQTLVVCRPGGELKQARDIAAEINRLYKAGAIKLPPRFNKIEDDEIACAIGGSVPSLNTDENIKLVKAEKRLLMTAVATGNEGLNIVNLDGLIVIGPRGAQWVVDQWLARIGRSSGQVAIAVEIFPHVLPVGYPLASIFRTYDMEGGDIKAGCYIGPHPDDKQKNPFPDPLPKMLGRLAAPQDTSAEEGNPGALNQTSANQAPQPAENPPEPYTPPAEPHGMLLDNISFREATIAPADLAKLPPPDYKPLNIPLPEGVPIEWAYGLLSKLNDPGIRYVGTWEEDEKGDKYYVRHYSPAAHEYFENNPVPELAGRAEFREQEIANMLNVSRTYVGKVIAALGIQPIPKLMKNLQKARHYDMDAVVRIKHVVEKRPMADETDIPISELEEELDIAELPAYAARYGITAVDKRRNPLWGRVGGLCLHITESEAYFLREVRVSVQQADPKRHISYVEIAQQAGLTPQGLSSQIKDLPEEKQPLFEWMNDGDASKPIRFADREWGEALVEYIKPEKVLPWEVTIGMLCKYFGLHRNSVQSKLNKIGASANTFPFQKWAEQLQSTLCRPFLSS